MVALVCTAGNIMCDTLIYKVNGLMEYKNVTQYLGKVSDDPTLREAWPGWIAICSWARWTWTDQLWQIRFTTKFFFDAGLYFPKFSLVMSYSAMVPVTEPRMRIFLTCIATYLVLACLTAIFADTFWCGSYVSINW